MWLKRAVQMTFTLFNMRMFKLLTIFWLCLLLQSPTFGQSLSSSRRVNWAQGVSKNTYPYPTQTINFITAGGNNTGNVANDSIMNSVLAIIGSSGAIVYFPAGQYLFNSKITLKQNVVIQGESANSTTLKFNLGGSNNLIEVKGTQGATTSNFTKTAVKEDTVISVANAASFQVGNFLKIADNDSSKVASSWAIGTTGQIVSIKAIQGNNITLTSPLRRDYLISKNPKITLLNPIKNVGIEKLTIRRLDTTATQTSHININIAANCWVSCVKSYNCNFAHVAIAASSNCSVIGSYFQDAFAYGGNGQGYGVVLQATSGECLVYNNIFKHLRHSMLFQSGANGNVASYNYSLDPFWTEGLFPSNAAGDLVFHGNYPYCNLAEGNIVQNIVIDNSHGLNGPFNTFNRNRAELYGISMNASAGDSTNFISNEVTNTTSPYGLFMLAGANNFQYGNNVKGTIYAAGTTGATANSLYLNDTLPYYTQYAAWPPIGTIATYNAFDNESKARFNVANLTQCWDNLTSLPNETNLSKLTLFPNPVSNNLTINGLKPGDSVKILDIYGNTLSQIITPDDSYSFSTENLPSGVYFCLVQNQSKQTVIKFLKVN